MVLSCDSAVDLMESKAEWKASYASMSEGRRIGCSVVEVGRRTWLGAAGLEEESKQWRNEELSGLS